MLNREEYNLAFKTTLSQEEFDEIMGKPVTDLSEVEELSIADRKGNVWRFLPKVNAIPIEYLKNLVDVYFDLGLDTIAKELDYIIYEWERENDKNI